MVIIHQNTDCFSRTITETAKILGLRRKDLIEILNKKLWIFRKSGWWLGYEAKVGAGLVEHRCIEIKHNSGESEYIPQVRITNKGIAWLIDNQSKF